MKTFPMFIDVQDAVVVIAGGGEQAAQKARLLLKTTARLVFMAPELEPELAGLVAAGRAEHETATLCVHTLRRAKIVFIATGCAGGDAAIAAVAKDLGKLVNVVDRPDLCDLVTPAIVDRDPVVVAIGTEGTAPVLSRQIKTKIEGMLEPRLGELAGLAGRLRGAVAQKVPGKERRAFWRWVFNGAPRAMFAKGQEAHAATAIKRAIEAGGATGDEERGAGGFVSLVGAGPGSPDLMTLRGVQRLQEADIIFYDRLVDDSVLELARRDAERVYVGKTPGATSWPQDRINGVIVAAGRAGKRVVRLKCGDPLVFGRAAEEADALEAAGIEWEVVPGVTSALAAAAQAKHFPTERGVSQHLTLSTGHAAAGKADPDFAARVVPGSTTAFYMAVAHADKVQASLLAAGVPGSAPVNIVASAETPDTQRVTTQLGSLADTVRARQVANPAIIFVTWPLALAAAAGEPARAQLAA